MSYELVATDADLDSRNCIKPSKDVMTAIVSY
jgi:hypothetical protein